MSIFSDYDDFKYIYPPRPETAIPSEQLDEIADGWIAQPKYNGSCAVLFINGHTNYKLFNRHGEELTLQKPIGYIDLNDSDRYMVLCGEYLNKNKKGEDGQSFNHKFIIWDMLVWRGKYLVGETFQSRMMLLGELFERSSMLVTNEGTMRKIDTGTASQNNYEHLQATEVNNVFLAPSYVNHFKTLFDDVVKTDLYEGLVLKRASAKLEVGFKEKNNSAWQVKARKETKNYCF